MLNSWCCCCSGEDQSTEERHNTVPGQRYGCSESEGIESSLRSHGSWSPEEKEKEKARLQQLVKEFANEAVAGVTVTVIDVRTGAEFRSTLQLEKRLNYLSLTPFMDNRTEQFKLKEVTYFCKGKEIMKHVAVPESKSALSVGMFLTDGSTVVFAFSTSTERDRFYTCMKILRMSVDIKEHSISAKEAK